LTNFYLARPGADEVQLDLFGDYKSNVALYPSFQDYFRHPEAAIPGGVGQERPVLCAPRRRGVQAGQSPRGRPVLRQPVTSPLETHASEIAESIRDFLK